MKNVNVQNAELLDIIFSGRNKQYGAYTLRKFYPQRIKNAGIVTTALLLSIFAVHLLIPPTILDDVLPPEIIPSQQILEIKDLIIPKTNAGKAGELSTTKPEAKAPLEIVEHQEIPTIEIIKPATDKPTPDILIAAEGSDAPSTIGLGGTDAKGVGAPTTGDADATVAKAPAAPPAKEMSWKVAEQMPQFPGGEDAMIRYIKKHLRYPARALSQGVEGMVYVQFVVNTRGKISNVKILSGIGAGCDSEAIRVISGMPAWSPGMQSGHKVNVEYVIPVQFEL